MTGLFGSRLGASTQNATAWDSRDSGSGERKCVHIENKGGVSIQASTMSVKYDFCHKPQRPAGLRARDFPYQSLHQPRLKPHVEPKDLTEEDIQAAPISSDEDILTDRSLSTGSSMKRKSPTFDTPGKSEAFTSLAEEDNECVNGPHHPPSIIPVPTRGCRKGSIGLSLSQGSQKGAELDEDLDPMDSFSSQRKRQRTTKYSSSSPSVNIHLSGRADRKKRPDKEDRASANAQMIGKRFKLPSIAAAHSIGAYNVTTTRNGAEHVLVDKIEADFEKPAFKHPGSGSSSPRSQRASQRSTQSTQISSQGSQRPEFKMPRKKTPKKQRPSSGIELLPVSNEENSSGRVMRFSVSAKKALVSTDPIALNNIQNAASIAGDKLGIGIPQLKPLISSASLSSAKDTSLEVPEPVSTIASPSEGPAEHLRPDDTYCITSEDMPIATRMQGLSICPFCKEPVEKQFMEEKVKIGKRLTIRQQAQFCRDHKKSAAEEVWSENGYPTIDWPNFNGRLNQYHQALDNILQRRRTSFYRNAFEDLVKSGKNWTWQQDVISGNRIEELSPGYYGGRGAKLMYAPIFQNDQRLEILTR